MAEPDFTIRQGDTASTLARTLTDVDGNPVNIEGATVTFTLVPIAGGEPLLDAAPANNDQDPDDDSTTGDVSYDWEPPYDTETPGFYLGTWTVTFGAGAVQSFPNSGYVLVHITPAAPTTVATYASVEEVKSTLEMTGTSFADDDIARDLAAATLAVEGACGRRFTLDADATSIRYYTPRSLYLLPVNDFVTLTAVAVDRYGDGTFEETWTLGTDFVRWPASGPLDGKPYEMLRARARGTRCFPVGIEDSVRVTARFGWPSVPAPVKDATIILAVKFLKRTREAPFGIYAVGIESGVAMRIAKNDPDVANLLRPYVKTKPF